MSDQDTGERRSIGRDERGKTHCLHPFHHDSFFVALLSLTAWGETSRGERASQRDVGPRKKYVPYV